MGKTPHVRPLTPALSPEYSGEGAITRLNLPRKLHLRSKADFDSVFDARTREIRGPIAVHARPNGLTHHRFGMSVSRKVGIAAKRNVIRRRLREAYRLLQHDLPTHFDLVVVVRPHPPLMLAEYQKLLSGAMVKLHAVWGKRVPLPVPVASAKADPTISP
ncbi:ribonuclease P protein component [Humisphaera borealis]|uniref:Ribonuclease P protein component n=1 Tax=Humisphaera borealis TaxID=2807512 RepID=A0A7M2WX73_9BACT|nr:ribonuclease P protein component [Humisphaera borealis]QOV90127.1 ribonuclease P protein component [Humisphaera borealis]